MRQRAPQPAALSSLAKGNSPPSSARPWGGPSARCQGTRSGAPGPARPRHPGAWGQRRRHSSAVEVSLRSHCQHSPGIHEPACECSARGSDLQGAWGRQGRQEAGSQLTLTHRLGTRQLVRCHTVQVATVCGGCSRSGMQGLGLCAETCSSSPCLAPSAGAGPGAPGRPQAAPGTLMVQGAVAAPKPQLLLSTLTAGEGAWLQGRGSQGSPLCWGYCHPTGRPAPRPSGTPWCPASPAPRACRRAGNREPRFGQGGRRASTSQAGDPACVPHRKVLGWEQPGTHRGLPASPAQMSLPSFAWHGKETESDRAL